jgi:hypothetical protein
MPFVFVHGVNVRDGADYGRDEKLRNAFLKEIVAQAVGISPATRIFSPYWGNEGIKFWRNLEVVPKGKGLETLGAEATWPPSLGIAIAEKKVSRGDTVDAIAHKSPDVAVDLLFDAAVAAAESEEDFAQLARSYKAAQDELASDTKKKWLADTKADELADDIYKVVRPTTTGEAFGGKGLWALFEEGAKRIALTIPDVASHAAVGAARKPLTRKIATFIGDAFQYLTERGDGTQPGPIASIVLKDLQEAATLAKQTNEPLVVICHSFGGEVVYDILTHYAESSELEVDTWVTVGSQVGLFEEMSLLWTSPGRTKPHTKIGNEAIASPKRVGRWINIVDTNDVLGFVVLPVFTGASANAVQDFKYDTGYPVTSAHSGYFEWPSFYKRLAHRIGRP